jgi:hypothetical protein
MLESMYVRCTQCGYDNSPEYRFCGMCGGSLPHPAKETVQPERDVVLPPIPLPAAQSAPPPVSAPAAIPVSASALGGGEKVHGPSFLGLSDDPQENFEYSDEDEPKRSRTPRIAVMVLLIAAAGLLGWQWRHNGFPFNRFTVSRTDGQPATPVAAPDATQNPETQAADKPVTANGDAPTAAQDTGKSTDSPGKAEGGLAQGTAAVSPNQDQSAPEGEAARAKASPRPRIPVKSSAKKPQPKTPAQSPAVETAALATSPDTDLEIAGERYLYGTGLPQNCTRAESSLSTAAAHGNSKAETVLGTMYATGHCVGRDLPTAYRWFARALHQEPQNSRISADLQVLWRQMTPQEKQLATISGH